MYTLKTSMSKDEPNDLSQLPSQLVEGEIYEEFTHDAVFGEITEGGPNYRNVWISIPDFWSMKWYWKKKKIIGWVGRDIGSHDEDANRSRRPFHSRRVQ